MRYKLTLSVLLLLVCFINFGPAEKEENTGYTGQTSLNTEKQTKIEDKLIVIWSSADREVALKMVFMYTYRAKKLKRWEGLKLLIWGPSAKLLSYDTELQGYVKKMKDENLEILACKACADMYEVTEKLTSLGVDVKYMGKELTNLIKSGWNTLTF